MLGSDYANAERRRRYCGVDGEEARVWDLNLLNRSIGRVVQSCQIGIDDQGPRPCGRACGGGCVCSCCIRLILGVSEL